MNETQESKLDSIINLITSSSKALSENTTTHYWFALGFTAILFSIIGFVFYCLSFRERHHEYIMRMSAVFFPISIVVICAFVEIKENYFTVITSIVSSIIGYTLGRERQSEKTPDSTTSSPN